VLTDIRALADQFLIAFQNINIDYSFKGVVDKEIQKSEIDLILLKRKLSKKSLVPVLYILMLSLTVYFSLLDLIIQSHLMNIYIFPNHPKTCISNLVRNTFQHLFIYDKSTTLWIIGIVGWNSNLCRIIKKACLVASIIMKLALMKSLSTP